MSPLKQSASAQAVRENTRREIKAGKDPKQAYAIAKANQRRARAQKRKKGGKRAR